MEEQEGKRGSGIKGEEIEEEKKRKRRMHTKKLKTRRKIQVQ